VLQCLSKTPVNRTTPLLDCLPPEFQACDNGFIISPKPLNSLYFQSNFLTKQTILTNESMYKLKTLAEYLGNSNDPLLQTIRPGFLLSFFLPHMGYSVKSTTLDVYISSNVTRNENIAQQYAHAAKSNQLNVESNLLDHPNFATSKYFFQKNTATAVFAHNTPIKYGHFNIKHSREIINFLTCMAESNELRLVSKGKTH